MIIENLSIAKCTTLAKGKPPLAIPYFGHDAEPYLSPEYLRNKGAVEQAKPATNAVRVGEGDTILLWDGSNAGEVFRSKAGILASTMTKLTHSDDFCSEYFFYAVKRWEAYLKGQTSGSGIPHVDKEILGKLEIQKLPLDEQALVAFVLDSVDRTIEQTEALIVKQQRIKTGLMQDLLTKGIDEHGNIRNEATHVFKDSPLGRIPIEWEVCSLSNLLTEISQGWSPDCKSETASYGEWGVLKTTSVVWDGYNSQENKRLPSNLKPRQQLEVRTGDVLMTRAGPNSRVGVVCYVYKTEPMRILSDKLYRLKTSDQIDNRFLVYSLTDFEAQKHLSNLKTGMAESQTNISQEIVRKLLTVMPDTKEQKEIANFLDKVCSIYTDNQSVLLKLHKLKHGLMQDLLTGKRRVTSLLKQAVTEL